MNKTAKKILYIGISLIIIALLLLIYFEWEEIYSKKESNDIMKTILNNKDNNKNEDEIVIDDLKYIGYIVIPTLDLNLPISKEFSYSSLRKSPTLYYGSLLLTYSRDDTSMLASYSENNAQSPACQYVA